MTPTEAPVSAQNSTNVRARHAGIPRWIQRTIRAGERAAPEALAWALEPWFFRTTRREPPAWERALTARGERTTVETLAGPVVSWSFGRGPLVVLVHGWNGRGAQLGALVDPLVRRGHRVVLFDAPAHGASPGRRASLLDFAQATLGVLDASQEAFGPARAIVAHSMGGAAVTYAMHERGRAAPIGDTTRAPLPAERFVFVAPPIDVRDFVRGFVRVLGAGGDLERSLHARMRTRLGVPLEALYAPSLARELRAPLLVIHDEEDREVPIDRGRRLAAAWPGATFEATRGLGHNRILREPAVVARAVAFIAD